MAHLLLVIMFLSVLSVCAADGNSLNEQTVSGSDLHELRRLKAAVERLESAERKRQVEDTLFSTGSSYVRWGRSTCDGDATVVYAGHAAGAHNTYGGGGSNRLCLHRRPQWKKYTPGFSTWAGYIYGVDHGIGPVGGPTVFSFTNNGGRSLLGHPASCALCYLRRRSTVVTIPGRTQCPLGWTKEYDGYIVGEYAPHGNNNINRHRTEYLCWDKAPQTATGGVSDPGYQGRLYPVKVICGSLPCSRYLNGFELACIVCSK